MFTAEIRISVDPYGCTAQNAWFVTLMIYGIMNSRDSQQGLM